MNRTLLHYALLVLAATFVAHFGGTSAREPGGDTARPPADANETPIADGPFGADQAHHITSRDGYQLLSEFRGAAVEDTSLRCLDPFYSALLGCLNAMGMTSARTDAGASASVIDMQRPTAIDDAHVSFLLVSIPDPAESTLGSFTDVILEGLERAIESQGYVLDRYRLPWRSSTDPHSGTILPPVRSATGPGIILYRRPQGRDPACGKYDLLLVFLIGETPTTGIDKPSLYCALDVAAGWGTAEALNTHQSSNRPEHAIDCLMPFFSGAVPSIRIALTEWFRTRVSPFRSERIQIKMVSGSASAIENKRQLEFSEHKHQCSLTASFYATIIPDAVIQNVVLNRHLSRRGIGLDQCAFFVEADTAFGESLVKPDSGHGDGDGKDPWFVLYPMRISAMRAAYGNDARLLIGRRRGPDGAPTLSLGLSPGDTRQTPHLLPSFSSTTISSVEQSLAHILKHLRRAGKRVIGITGTDVRDQLFLAELVRLHCPDAQLLLFRADSIFTHPQAAPALEGALVATTYPLIAGNQLWTDHGPAPKRIYSFTNVAAQGVFNATQALLVSSAQKQSLDTPLAIGEPSGSDIQFWPAEYCEPFANHAETAPIGPSVWLTVISNGEFQPLAQYSIDTWENVEKHLLGKTCLPQQSATRRYVLRAKISPEPNRDCGASPSGGGKWDIADGRSGAGALLAFLFSGFCIGSTSRFLYLKVQRRKRSRRPARRRHGKFRLLYLRALGTPCVRAHTDDLLWTPFYFLGLLLSVCAAALPALLHDLLWWRGAVDAIGSGSVPPLAVLVGIAEYLAAALLTMAVVWSGWRWAFRRGDAERNAILAIIVGTAAFLAFWCVYGLRNACTYATCEDLGSVAMFVQRSAFVGSQLAPGISLFFILLALALALRCELQRVEFANAFAMHNPFPAPSPMAKSLDTAGFATLTAAVIRSAEQCVPPLSDERQLGLRAVRGRGFATITPLLAWQLFAVVCLVLLLTAWGHHVPAYDCRYFYGMVWFSWLLAFIAVWRQLFMALWLLYRFLELLRRIARHPMADAFQRLPGKIRLSLKHLFLLPNLPRRYDLERVLRICVRLRKTRVAAAKAATQPESTNVLNSAACRKVLVAMQRSAGDFANWLNIQDRREPANTMTRNAFESRIADTLSAVFPSLPALWRERLAAADAQGANRANSRYKLPPSASPISLSREERDWLLLAEDLLIHQLSTLFRQILKHLNRLLFSALAVIAFFLASMNSYDYQPKAMLIVFSWALISVFVIVAVNALIKLNRNELLSRIVGTAPDKVTWNVDFVASLLAYGALPILSALAFQFPQVGRVVFFINDALLHAFK